MAGYLSRLFSIGRFTDYHGYDDFTDRYLLPKRPRPAAGLLPTFTDADGTWFLLGKRSRTLGGNWSTLGGSLHPGEDPLAGALREFHEESRIGARRLIGATITAVIDSGTPTRPYTLFVVEVPLCFDDAELGWENDDLLWLLGPEVDRYALRGRLHPGFARAWAQVRSLPAVAR